MGEILLAVLAIIHYELLLFAAVGLALGGLDDLLIDILYLCRRAWRHAAIYSRHPRMTTATLPSSPTPGPIAIFVPAWQEAEVIAPMLRHALACWGTADYRLFVGAYPNDPATLAQIAEVAVDEPRIVLGINPRHGPTTKGDCLNILWRALLGEEQRTGRRFKAIVLHDAEDVIHPDEIALFDVMIDRFELVQLPVLPLPGQGSSWSRAIANHYGDEFAEAHTKSLIMREALGASMPSAGVACAFARDSLARLSTQEQGGPFDPGSLTEDYEVGLRIRDHGGKGVFVRMRDRHGDLVATREHFPDTLQAAIKQKARWIVGISLAGWDRMGWRGGPMEWWMRLRDRRGVIAALILFAAYVQLLVWGLLGLIGLFHPVQPMIISPALLLLLGLNAALLLWRTAMRVVFVTQCYGWRQGLWSIPRTFLGNYIAILAARRAFSQYLDSLFGKPLTWDKTQHRFPAMQPDP